MFAVFSLTEPIQPLCIVVRLGGWIEHEGFECTNVQVQNVQQVAKAGMLLSLSDLSK